MFSVLFNGIGGLQLGADVQYGVIITRSRQEAEADPASVLYAGGRE